VFRLVDWARFDLNSLSKGEHGRLVLNNMIIFRAVIAEIEAAVVSFKSEDQIIIEKFGAPKNAGPPISGLTLEQYIKI